MEETSMKAFITGATGFLGTNLIQKLVRDDWEIVALHRPKSDISELLKHKNISLKVGDITDLDSLQRALSPDIDVVFHVAGSVANLPASLENSRYDVNHLGTRNLVSACIEQPPKRLIFTSTVLTLDFRACQPLTEQAPKNWWIRDAYAKSKRLAEDEILRAENSGIEVVYLHPSAMFGAYDKATWSKMFLEIERGLPLPAAPPGGGSVCHARAVADAHVTAAHKGKSGRHYILGGPDVTWFEVINKIAHLLGRSGASIRLPVPLFKAYGWTEFILSNLIRREPMLTPHTITMLSETVFSDSTRAIEELDYKPSSLEEMLSDCHRWMIDSGMLAAPQKANLSA